MGHTRKAIWWAGNAREGAGLSLWWRAFKSPRHNVETPLPSRLGYTWADVAPLVAQTKMKGGTGTRPPNKVAGQSALKAD